MDIISVKELKAKAKQIDDEASTLRGSEDRSDRARLRSLRKEREQLKVLILYLETNPSKEFIINQRNALQEKLRAINGKIDEVASQIYNSSLSRSARKQLSKDYGVPDLLLKYRALTKLVKDN